MVTSTQQHSPPRTIIASFLGFLVATVTVVAGAVFLAMSAPELAEELRRTRSSLTDAEIDRAVTFAQGVGIAFAVVFALGYLWLAFKLKAGRNWARVVLTLLTLVQVGFVVAAGTTTAGYVSCAVAVLAVVLSYLPSANTYIARTGHAG